MKADLVSADYPTLTTAIFSTFESGILDPQVGAARIAEHWPEHLLRSALKEALAKMIPTLMDIWRYRLMAKVEEDAGKNTSERWASARVRLLSMPCNVPGRGLVPLGDCNKQQLLSSADDLRKRAASMEGHAATLVRIAEIVGVGKVRDVPIKKLLAVAKGLR